MSKTISINGREIGPNAPPYIIAELSANHNGDLARAFRIMELAKQSGADALKLQTYSADTITINHDSEDFQIRGGLWDGRTLYELYEWAQMPWDWHKPLFAKAAELGISIFSSPFDVSAVDLLEDLNCPAYKISSFEAIDLPLIRYVAGTGKPIIISTGMANAEEITEAVDAARAGGCSQLAVLHCVSGYPAPAADYNLLTLSDIARRHQVVPGLSDHTLDNTTAIAAVALGACIIEKHVTLDRAGGGPDDSFSLEAEELAQLVAQARTAWEALGQVNYARKESEKGNANFRRSLYIVKDIAAGEALTAMHVRSIRPGFGLLPKYLEIVIGRKVRQDISFGTALQWDMLEDAGQAPAGKASVESL